MTAFFLTLQQQQQQQQSNDVINEYFIAFDKAEITEKKTEKNF